MGAKKIFNIALKVATWLLVAFTVFMMVFTVVSVTTVNKNERSLFGSKFYIVKTDSMSLSENNADLDVHFDAGDIIIVKNLDNQEKLQLKEGDIIAFMSTNPESYGETVTHMIHSVKTNSEGKLLGYVTYGTNTGVIDEALVEPSYILGLYTGKMPTVGRFFAFVKSVPGYIMCILVPFMLLILYNGVNVIRLFRRYKSEQMEAMQDERNKIDAERAETQRMMQELLALKAQLAQQGGEAPPAEAPPTAEPATEAPAAQETPAQDTPVMNNDTSIKE